MKYIIESRDGFQRVFPRACEITLDDEWFCITDENNIRWEFNNRHHKIHKIYEKGDWELLTDTDKLLVQNEIECLKKIHPENSFEMQAIKIYNGNYWHTTIYEMGTSISYKIIL